jgi:hypothetical protein
MDPIKAIEGIPGDIHNWVLRQIQRAEIQAKIDALTLIDWAGQEAAIATHKAVQDQIADLKNQLSKLN